MKGKVDRSTRIWLASVPRGMALTWLAVLSAGAATAAPPPGLLLHFDFNQAPVGGMVADRSGNQHDARLLGGKWTTAGKTGGGLECSSPAAGARVEGKPTLPVAKATLALWFRPTKEQSHPRTLLQCGGLRLFLAGDPKERGKVAAQVNDGPLALSEAVLPVGEWHHAAATFDGNRLRLYLDGTPQQQSPETKAPPAAGPTGLFLGIDPTASADAAPAGGPPEFLFDEVMAFGRALSPEEIKSVVLAVDPKAGMPKPKFTRAQVAGQLRNLDLLYAEGLLTDAYYTRKVRELEAAVAE
jgi:hypothetical protein